MILDEKRAEYIRLAEEAFKDKSLNKALLDCLPYAAMLIHRDRIVLAANRLVLEMGVVVGTNCWDTFGKRVSIPDEDRAYVEKHNRAPESGTKCTHCLADEALDKDEPVNVDVKIGETIWDTYWIPVGEGIYLHYGIDVTKKRSGNDTL